MQIADAQGNICRRNSFDAWGYRRNPATQITYAVGTAPGLMLSSGYTGHEHLAVFGLINMNARLYDPILERFLSTAPYVQSPDFTQAFNRYSYCMNSPLCYVDENGEFFLISLFTTIKYFVVNIFGRVWAEGFNAWSNSSNWHATSDAWEMTAGFFDYYSPFTADIDDMGIVSLFHHVQYNGTKQHGWDTY